MKKRHLLLTLVLTSLVAVTGCKTKVKRVPLDEVIDEVAASNLTKFPVYEDDLDQTMGILHSKDLLRYIRSDGDSLPLRDIVRPALFVSESIKIGDLLGRLREGSGFQSTFPTQDDAALCQNRPDDARQNQGAGSRPDRPEAEMDRHVRPRRSRHGARCQ